MNPCIVQAETRTPMGAEMQMQTRVPPLAVAAGAALGQLLVARSTPRRTARTVTATALATASAALLASSVRAFRRSNTSVNPLEPAVASTLVTGGPNRLTRNPMYLGMAGLLAAHAIARGRTAALLPVAGFIAYIDRLQVAPEEAALRAQFGEDYAAYVHDVPRWLDLRTLRAVRVPMEGPVPDDE